MNPPVSEVITKSGSRCKKGVGIKKEKKKANMNEAFTFKLTSHL